MTTPRSLTDYAYIYLYDESFYDDLLVTILGRHLYYLAKHSSIREFFRDGLHRFSYVLFPSYSPRRLVFIHPCYSMSVHERTSVAR